MCERWVRDWTKTATYWHPIPPSLAALLSSSAGLLNRGPSGPSSLLGAGSHYLELQRLTPNSKLTQTSCSTGLYNCLKSTCFSEIRICTQFIPSTVNVIPWYLRPDAPIIYTGAFLIWQPGGSICYKTTPNECPDYDTKKSNSAVPVMLEIWECRVPLHCHRS